MRCKYCDTTGNSNDEQSPYRRSLKLQQGGKVYYSHRLKEFICQSCEVSIIQAIRNTQKRHKQ